MKKLLSILLSLAVLFSMLPASVSADDSISDREKTLALACELFPEHASTIRNGSRNIQRNRSIGAPAVLVLSETKQASADTTLTYMEYSDGTSYLASLWDHTIDTVDSDVSSSGDLIKYTVDLTVYSTIAVGEFKVKNIKFCLDSLWYDNITSGGYIASDSVSGYQSDIKEWEDKNGKAYVSYDASFPRSNGTGPNYEPTFTFYVGNDSCSFAS